MCLHRRIPAKDAKKIIDLVKSEGKTVYKIVGIEDGQYFPISCRTNKPYKVGPQKADTGVIIRTDFGEYYKSGFHFFQSIKDSKDALIEINERLEDEVEFKRLQAKAHMAAEFIHNKYVIIKCKIKKSWITAIGVDGGSQKAIIIITNKAIFPEVK